MINYMKKFRIILCIAILIGLTLSILWNRSQSIDDTYQVACCDQVGWKDVKVNGEIAYSAVNTLFNQGELYFTGNISIDEQTFAFSSDQRLAIFPQKQGNQSKYTFFFIKNNIGDELAEFLGADFVLCEYDKQSQNITVAYSDPYGEPQTISLDRCP